MISEQSLLLAVNSGSSSLKVGCYRHERGDEILVLSGLAEGIGREDGRLSLRSASGEILLDQPHLSETQDQALGRLADALAARLAAPPVAIGHRVVHGGPALRVHQRITTAVLEKLRAAVHLAPLHIPEALSLIQATERIYPNISQFACFDTIFHRTMPDVATHLPLPTRYFDQGVQRYGFHGLSCESVMRRLGPRPPGRIVIAHLGNGSSLTAVRDGLSVDTSMAFSPTAGIPMGTRTGDLDPGVLLYLLRTESLTADALEAFVNHECGLAGLSGGEADMQKLLEGAAKNDSASALAIDVFCTEIRKRIGSYAALLGGLDLLVFTGGIGEHSADIRTRVTGPLSFLFPNSVASQVLVLAAEEEAEIAHHCRGLLQASAG